ncbi:MAG: RNHCP domain-containing protein [bacterium]
MLNFRLRFNKSVLENIFLSAQLKTKQTPKEYYLIIYQTMKKINESFTCIHCGKQISQAAKTCRNHCPFCFVSRHVDGDIP